MKPVGKTPCPLCKVPAGGRDRHTDARLAGIVRLVRRLVSAPANAGAQEQAAPGSSTEPAHVDEIEPAPKRQRDAQGGDSPNSSSSLSGSSQLMTQVGTFSQLVRGFASPEKMDRVQARTSSAAHPGASQSGQSGEPSQESRDTGSGGAVGENLSMEDDDGIDLFDSDCDESRGQRRQKQNGKRARGGSSVLLQGSTTTPPVSSQQARTPPTEVLPRHGAPRPAQGEAQEGRNQETTERRSAPPEQGFPEFYQGAVVTVAPRTGPGQNKLGGAALIKKVNEDGTFDVKYTVEGGTERRVPASLLQSGVRVAKDLVLVVTQDGDLRRASHEEDGDAASAAGIHTAEMSPSLARKCVGKRCLVSFADDEAEQTGQIVGYHDSTGRHKVLLSSGESEWLSLSEEGVTVLDLETSPVRFSSTRTSSRRTAPPQPGPERGPAVPSQRVGPDAIVDELVKVGGGSESACASGSQPENDSGKPAESIIDESIREDSQESDADEDVDGDENENVPVPNGQGATEATRKSTSNPRSKRKGRSKAKPPAKSKIAAPGELTDEGAPTAAASSTTIRAGSEPSPSSSSSSSSSAALGSAPKIILTGFERSSVSYKRAEAACLELGGQVLSDVKGVLILDADHVVATAASSTEPLLCKSRTLKYLMAIAQGKWIVREKWISDSLKAGRWLPEAAYEMVTDRKTRQADLPAGGPRRAREARARAEATGKEDKLLLSGLSIHLCGAIQQIGTEQLEIFVQCCGGRLVSDEELVQGLAGDEDCIVLTESAEQLRNAETGSKVVRLESDGRAKVVLVSWLLDCLGCYTRLDTASYLARSRRRRL